MKEINKLLKRNKNFLIFVYLCSALYMIIFLVFLVFSMPYPVLALINWLFIIPGTCFFVRILFKLKTAFEKDIKNKLQKLIYNKLEKKLIANYNSFMFDIKVLSFTDYSLVLIVSYTGIKYELFNEHIAKVKADIDANLPDWFNLTLFCTENQTHNQSIIV